MTFTFDLESDDSTKRAIARIRLYIGDDKADPKGALPEGQNLPDAALLALYRDEGEDVNRAVAAGFEKLATEWARHVTKRRIGPLSEEYKAKEYYEMKGCEWRKRYGHAQVATRPVVGTATVSPFRVNS